jgi:kynureninase
MINAAALAVHYSRFRVGERILLTGHSHQAWPDAGFEAQQRAWLDAAEYVDDKWPHCLQQAERVKEGFGRLVGDSPDRIALGANTHELVTRWLSALPLRQRPCIVTTDREFRSLQRQLKRLAEEGVAVVVTAANPVATLAERVAAAVTDRVACVITSSVFFDTAEIVPELHLIARACERVGARCLVDAYHHLNVVPFDLAALGLETAFVTGGGYKYCQLGEGNCFLRVPEGCRLRPVLTGWFAELTNVDSPPGGAVSYEAGARAFTGATYDPTSHYRAAAVFAFHQQQRLTPDRLRTMSRQQVGLLKRTFEQFDLDPRTAVVESIPDERRGGFLALRSPHAAAVASSLRAESVFVDARGDILRVGPAPYLRDDQVRAGMEAICRRVRELTRQ